MGALMRLIGWIIFGSACLLYFMKTADAGSASDRILDRLDDRDRPAVSSDRNGYDARCFGPTGRTVATVRGRSSASAAVREAQREAERFGGEAASCRVDRRR